MPIDYSERWQNCCNSLSLCIRSTHNQINCTHNRILLCLLRKTKIVYIIVANDWIEANMFHFSSSISTTMSNDEPVNNLCQISQCFCAAGGGIETRPFSQVPARDFPFCLFLNKTWGMKSRSGDRNQSSWTSCDHLRTIRRQSQTQKRTHTVDLCFYAPLHLL